MHVTTSGRTWKGYDAGTLTLTILITFQFDVTGIHIVEEFGSSTEWPNRDGRFDLADFRRECTLKVEGNLCSIHVQAANPRPSPTSSASYSPLFRFVLGDAFLLEWRTTFQEGMAAEHEVGWWKIWNPDYLELEIWTVRRL